MPCDSGTISESNGGQSLPLEGSQESSGTGSLVRRGYILQQTSGVGRASTLLRFENLEVQLRGQRLQAAHRGGMGVRLPRRKQRRLFFRGEFLKAWRLCLVRKEFGWTTSPGRAEATESIRDL